MSTLKVDYLTNRLGTGAPQLTYGATIPAGQNLSVGGNLTVTGNLTVNGTTTTVDTTNTTIKDSLLELNSGAASNANDLGLIFERGSTGDNAALLWDESADKFALGTTTATGASTGDLTLTTATLVANLEGSQSGGSIDATTITGSSDLAINTNTLFVDVSEGAVGLGSATPGGPAQFGTNNDQPINCLLDVSYGGSGAGAGGLPQVSMLIGADSNANTRTDNVAKEFRIASPHYSISELPVLFAMATNDSTSNALNIGHGTSSCSTPTVINFKVNSTRNISSGTHTPQLTLKGIDGEWARLELQGAGISETFSGDFSSSLNATPSFNAAVGTVRYYSMGANITRIAFTNVDTANSRATTFQVYLSSSSAYTIAGTNGVTVNGGAAQNLRFPNGVASVSHSGTGIDVLTVVITVDGGGAQRVFGFLSKGH